MLESGLAPYLYLTLEICLVAGLALGLFRLRRRWGLGLLYVFFGSTQFLAMVLASTLYIELGGGVSVSPGSVVLFTASLYAILLVYLREDIPQTRTLIYGILLANGALTVLSWLTTWQIRHLPTRNVLEVPLELFSVHPRAFLLGSAIFVVDAILIIVVYEFLLFSSRRLPLFGRVMLAPLAVLYVDALLFTLASYGGTPLFGPVLVGQLAGKSFAGAIFGLLLYGYLVWIEPSQRDRRNGDTDLVDVFSILTYRERYEIVRRELAEAKAASEAKSRFLAHMSHELRTPLTAVIGFTDLLLRDDEAAQPERQRLFLQRIRDNARQLLRLIDGLLDLSRIEAGRVELESTEVELRGLVRETIAQLSSQAGHKSLRLDSRLPEFEVRLTTDPERLRQVLLNLIGNAIKFTDDGAVSVRLVADASTRQAARIEVADTGIGIPEEKQGLIFEAFEQAESGDDRSYDGTGLGLAISRALCEKMGFDLGVRSRPGSGSVFTILLAQRPADAEEAMTQVPSPS